MTINRYLRAYTAQKHHSATRGVEFLLTFKEWCDFWGDDIGRRGNGVNDLQMQRFADTGPYQVGNIRKGTPKENAKTAGHMKRNRAAIDAHRKLQNELDRAMFENYDPEPDDDGHEEGMPELGLRSSLDQRYSFRA